MNGKKLILLGPLPPPNGGVSVYLSALADHLRPFGVRVWAYTGKGENDSNTSYFNHRRLGILPLMLRGGRKARFLDATHFHLEYPNPLLVPLWLVLKLLFGFEWYKNILDGTLPNRQKSFSFTQRVLFGMGTRAVDQFVVVSEDLKKWLVDDLRVKQPVHVVPCLLPPVENELDGVLSQKVRQVLNTYSKHEVRVASCGAFVPTYGFMNVAIAVEKLRNRTKRDIGLLFLDGAFTRDEAYRDEVLRHREWITVVEDLPHDSVPEVLKMSHSFVRAAVQEGYGISRIEALWCTLPVIATRVGETRGMLLFDSDDVEGLILQLERALFGEWDNCDSRKWSVEFRREASENLLALKAII